MFKKAPKKKNGCLQKENVNLTTNILFGHMDVWADSGEVQITSDVIKQMTLNWIHEGQF